MAQKLSAGLPENLDLTQPYTITFAALDPTSGAAVTGVVISNAQIHAANLSGSSMQQLTVGPPEQPLWLPIPTSILNTDTTGG